MDEPDTCQTHIPTQAVPHMQPLATHTPRMSGVHAAATTASPTSTQVLSAGHAVVDSAAADIMQRWRAGVGADTGGGVHGGGGVMPGGGPGPPAPFAGMVSSHNAWARQAPRLVVTPMSTQHGMHV